ncbi:hypothetical protein A2U01_0087478, partial [Trifolium medium]|nr:hypothetical protein [Trifolium medium]
GRKLISCCVCIIAGSAAATLLSLNVLYVSMDLWNGAE